MFRYFNRGLAGAIRQSGIHSRRVVYAGAISGVAGYLYFNNMSSLGRAQIHNDAIIPPLKAVATKYNTVSTDVINKLRSALGEENVITDKEIIQGSVNSQWSYLVDLPPSVIVTPSNTEDVVNIVNVARDNHIPIISRSAGTSLEGHCSAESGGIMIDFEQRMANVLEVYPDDMQVRVQPGVKWVELNEYLEEVGLNLFFPLDPSPGAAIGGMLSTGCSGTNACMYGTARGEWFVNITVVMPNGKIMKTRQRAKKSSAGIDMTKLFVGAEGTLGVITELTLRLVPKVPTSVAVAPFDSIEDAAKGVAKVIQSGISVNCAELLDDLAIIANNNSGSTYKKYEEKPHIFFKFAGTQAHMAEDAERTAAIVKEFGSKLEYAENDEEAKNLWEARKWGLANIASMVPNSRIWTTDVCVPQSRLPTLVKQIKSDAVEAGIYAPLLSHCADGNAHFLLVFKDDKEREIVEHLVEKMVERAQALDGTCTGEHSVGVGKKHHLVHELGEETVRALWTLKNAFDPDNIMNPGKLYPDIDTRY